MAQNGLAEQVQPRRQEPEAPIHTQASPVTGVQPKLGRVPFSAFGKVLCTMLGLVVLAVSILLVSSKIAVSNAQADLQSIQTRTSKVQTKNTSATQEINDLASRSRLNKIAKKYGLSLDNGNIRNVNK